MIGPGSDKNTTQMSGALARRLEEVLILSILCHDVTVVAVFV